VLASQTRSHGIPRHHISQLGQDPSRPRASACPHRLWSRSQGADDRQAPLQISVNVRVVRWKSDTPSLRSSQRACRSPCLKGELKSLHCAHCCAREGLKWPHSAQFEPTLFSLEGRMDQVPVVIGKLLRFKVEVSAEASVSCRSLYQAKITERRARGPPNFVVEIPRVGRHARGSLVRFRPERTQP